MKKAVIALSVALAVLIVGIVGGYIKLVHTVKTQVANADKIYFLGNSYTRYEEQSNFIAFGEQNRAWSDVGGEKVKFKNLHGLSYCKTDEDRNFVYNETMFGEDIFIRDGYTVPVNPEPDSIDMIEFRLFNKGSVLFIYIYDREDINTLVSYFDEIRGEYELESSTSDDNGTRIFGASDKYGGWFIISDSCVQDNNGEIFFITMDGNKFPVSDEIENLLNGYIAENS